jgi:hypothetical protein
LDLGFEVVFKFLKKILKNIWMEGNSACIFALPKRGNENKEAKSGGLTDE